MPGSVRVTDETTLETDLFVIEAEVARGAWDSLAIAPGALVGVGIRRIAIFPA